jgi:hypothetical protein
MRKPQYLGLTYRSLLLPLTFLPIIWQRMTHLDPVLVFRLSADQAVFSTQLFFKNLAHAWNFFSGNESRYGMIPILFYLALAGLACSLFWLFRHRKGITSRVRGLTIAGSLTLIAHAAIIFSYHYGNLTIFHSMRFGIIFLPFIVYFVILLLNGLTKGEPPLKSYLLVGSVVLLFFYWPIAGQNEALHQSPTHREYRFALNFLNQNYANSNVMIISDRPGMYIIQRWGSVSFRYANKYYRRLFFEKKRHRFEDIIVIQKIQYSNNRPQAETRLNSKYKLKPIFEAQLNSRRYVRFSKVVP